MSAPYVLLALHVVLGAASAVNLLRPGPGLALALAAGWAAAAVLSVLAALSVLAVLPVLAALLSGLAVMNLLTAWEFWQYWRRNRPRRRRVMRALGGKARARLEAMRRTMPRSRAAVRPVPREAAA